MADNVHRLSGQAIEEDQQEILSVARRILDLAETGHLRTLAWADTTKAGEIKTGWAMGEDSRWAETLGAAAALMADLGPGSHNDG